MGVTLSFLLLIGFLAGFFGLDQLAQGLQALGIASVSGDDLVMGNISGFQISLSLSALRVLLAGGAVFFEFIIIVLSVFDRVVDTLKAIIRPLIMTVPIAAFLYSAYNTFEPVVRSLLPPEFGGGNPAYIAQAANNELPRNILITFGAMVFFLLMSSFLGGGSTAEIKRLRAELRRCRERLR